MATYKNGFKHKKDERFVTYVLIGFAVTFFVILVSIILYNVIAKPLEYSSFDTIDDYALITSKPESEYLVYYYSETCPACAKIKQDALEFADKNNAGVKVYFMDAGKTTGQNNIPGMDGYPSMLTVINGNIIDLTSGYVDIPAVFEQINNGTYAYIN